MRRTNFVSCSRHAARTDVFRYGCLMAVARTLPRFIRHAPIDWKSASSADLRKWIQRMIRSGWPSNFRRWPSRSRTLSPRSQQCRRLNAASWPRRSFIRCRAPDMDLGGAARARQREIAPPPWAAILPAPRSKGGHCGHPVSRIPTCSRHPTRRIYELQALSGSQCDGVARSVEHRIIPRTRHIGERSDAPRYRFLDRRKEPGNLPISSTQPSRCQSISLGKPVARPEVPPALISAWMQMIACSSLFGCNRRKRTLAHLRRPVLRREHSPITRTLERQAS